MKKIIITTILIGILVLGAIFYFLVQKDQSKQAEILEKNGDSLSTGTSTLVKSGEFIKIDPLHYASGKVTVEKIGDNYKLVFANNFSSEPGPDLYVYLSSPQNYKNIALGGVDTSKTLNIGKLKSTNSSQEYLISKKDFELYSDSVIIWCKSFKVQFSRADLKQVF